MDKKFSLLINFVFISLVISGSLFAKPEFISVKENSVKIGKHEKSELTIDLKATFTNPFDPEDISLKGVFKSPSGSEKAIDGFYCYNFTVSRTNSVKYTQGNNSWKIRFTPDEIGTWIFSLICIDSTGTSDYSNNTFNCLSSGNRGFIRRSPTNYFQFDNGENFFVIGENMCWYGHDRLFDYRKWIDELSVNGGNFIRLWMSSWATALEWKENGLGNYLKRQDRAYDLDWIIDYAAEKGVYIMLCFINHGAVSTYVNPESIKLKINKPSRIQISVENYLGQQIEIISKGFYSLGLHKINWDSEKLAPGLYFIKISSSYTNQIIKYFHLD